MKRFDQPIPVTRPVLPDLGSYYRLLMETFHSGVLTNGAPLHQQLERTLAGRLGAPGLVLCANGTLALMTALCSLPLSGEVVTTPFTFPATPHAITLSGLTPVFADVDPETGNLTPESTREAITDKTSCILPVHVYGTPCDVSGFEALARERGLFLVYDAAHAFGAEIGGVPITRFGHASALSFHATKLFHTAEGGAVCFNDERAAEYARLFRNFGIEDEETVSIVGFNAKMSELHAAMGLLVLDLMEEEWRARMRHIGAYRQRLQDIAGIKLPPQQDGASGSAQYFVIRIQEAYGRSRDETAQKLREYNVFARKYFYPLASDCPAYARLNTRPLPVARRIAEEALALPLYGALQESEVAGICDLLRGLRK